MVLLCGLGLFGMVCFTKWVEIPLKTAGTFAFYFYRAVPMAAFILGVLSTIWLTSLILTLFHQYRGDVRPLVPVRKKAGLVCFLKRAAVIVCAVFAVAIFSETELGGSLMIGTYTSPQVVAHRSGALSAPENTMAALDNAIAMNVDMVEIDVQQLKDGTLILLHDDSFNRTAGKDKKVWEAEYDEVKHYDAGSWFSPRFSGEPVPRLDDFLKRARGNVQVMIELKFTGHETGLVEGVVALIEKYDMLNDGADKRDGGEHALAGERGVWLDRQLEGNH